MKNKRGQLTLFIILSILIVAIVLLFVFWIKPTYISSNTSGLNFEKCIEETTLEATEQLALNAGYIKPEFTYKYLGEEYQYLCYTNEPYKTCTVQSPLILNKFKINLLESIEEKINICYRNSVNQLKEQGLDVKEGELETTLDIKPDLIEVTINAPTTIEGKQFTTIKRNIDSPIYNLLIMATTIIDFETTYGDTNTDDLMLLYPELKITKYKQDDSTTIYYIEDKDSEIKFQFASRSLIFPNGYGIQ